MLYLSFIALGVKLLFAFFGTHRKHVHVRYVKCCSGRL